VSGSSVTKRCETCERIFDGDETFCPFDATALVAWEPDDPMVGRVIADRYRILRPLGAGGMGVVYVAEQAPIGRRVAVKLLKDSRVDNPRAVERFKQEAQVIAGLKSPHTVTLFEFGQTQDGALFLIMELLEGLTLGQLLQKRGRLSLEEVAPLMDQVARGLSEAHAAGLVHRDIKPDNIFLSRSTDYTQFVKLLDFGVAASLEAASASDDARLTKSGELPGTPGYLAPERITGDPFDTRSDIYALGVTMYESLTGRMPYRHSGSWDVLVAHLNDDPMPLEEACPGLVLPDAVVGFLWRCMAKMPDSRPRDALEFRRELMQAMAVSDAARWSYDSGLVVPAATTTDRGAMALAATVATGPELDAPAEPAPKDTPSTENAPRRGTGLRVVLVGVVMLLVGGSFAVGRMSGPAASPDARSSAPVGAAPSAGARPDASATPDTAEPDAGRLPRDAGPASAPAARDAEDDADGDANTDDLSGDIDAEVRPVAKKPSKGQVGKPAAAPKKPKPTLPKKPDATASDDAKPPDKKGNGRDTEIDDLLGTGDKPVKKAK